MKNAAQLFEYAPELDAALIISEKNRMYFTGFASTYGFLLILRNKTVFFTDQRYYEMAQILQDDGVEVISVAGGNSAYAPVTEYLQAAGAHKVGFEDTEITVADYSELKERLSSFELLPAGGAVNMMRRVKSDSEIECVKQAQSFTDAAFSEILGFLREGVTEIDVATELEYRMKKHGATGLAFETIVASGVNTSKPHAHPTDKKLEKGDAVTMDFGASYNGYCSDMTRTVFIGEPSAEMKKIYDIVLLAQKTAISSAYAGMTGRELDAYAREVISANGHGEHFTHSTGHSLGIDIHEEPRASINSEDILKDNMFITVEPGIYIPSFGGVRIEDLLLIRKDGVIDLTRSEKNIIIL